MILQSLVRYYEMLEKKGEITIPGWCAAKVSFALALSEEGKLLRIHPLKLSRENGKKTVEVAQRMVVPEMATRASNILSNFLCDNSGYFLGIDNKGKPERTKECFEAARAKHREILSGCDGKAARAVLRFFETWNQEEAARESLETGVLADCLEDILKGGNLVFTLEDNHYAHDDDEIKNAWKRYYETPGEGKEGICMVTGERTEIARIHGTLRGVKGAQPSGAALVSFHAPAFESYGKEQSFNAPVGVYAAYAYTTALNQLLSDIRYHVTIGDTTVVYWSGNGEEAYPRVFSAVMEPTADNAEILTGIFKLLEEGKAVDTEGAVQNLSLNQKFYILGLAPNAARLAVRFFYEDSFGNILKHVKAHYDRMAIVRPYGDSMEHLGIWRMLSEIVNKKSRDKKPAANLAGSIYRAVISGSSYPEGLYQAVLGRIRAEQDDSKSRIYKITRGRAAIIKAHLLRNRGYDKEEITMGLNENCTDTAYLLGREFAVLERIQADANPGINATIKDRYFNSACAAPASIFPILFKLKNSHIRKISSESRKIFFEQRLGEVQGMIPISNDGSTALPKRLDLEGQGKFILGYYHQTQKLYEKKTKEEVQDGRDN